MDSLLATGNAVHRYCRADVLRILKITAQQLAGWQKAGLVAAAETYSFFELLQLKKIRDLRGRHVRPAIIRASLEAMRRQVAGMANPLVEAGTFSAGSRVVFRHRGAALEPLAGQFVMDFSPEQRVVSAKVRAMPAIENVGDMFVQAIGLEDDSTTQADAIHCYERILQLDPRHAAAHINLGTLYYNRQEFAAAELHYRQAIEADSHYALGYFDLGNVLDETGRVQEATQAYQTAISLAPTYADAHYNLALAFEKLRQPRKALRHWRAYIKLDRSSPWSTHAANQIQRILATEPLKVVFRRMAR
ncbi:MAG: tetratricopeptide repeat protein [Acidobacteria bacterium]|nr:tetratricopeptide repeat protein [Acidobacteriota bacterium]